MSYEVPLHKGPILCPYCNVEANYVDSKIIYGISFGFFYLCSNFPTCDARTTARGEGRPIGTLAREELRNLRKACHAKFDPLWQSGFFSRSDAYAFLQKIMSLINASAAHIGQFDEQRCKRFLMRIDCKTCREFPGEFGPNHEGSSACRNYRVCGHGSIAAGGTVAHCTCAGCF